MATASQILGAEANGTSKWHVPLDDWRGVGADTLSASTGTYGTLAEVRAGAVDCNNNTKTVAGIRTFRLPAEQTLASQVDNGLPDQAKLTFNMRCRITGAPATSASLSVKASRLTSDGAVDTSIGTAGELNTTAAANLKDVAANTWVTRSFVIDTSQCVANDRIQVAFQAALNDSGGAGGGHFEVADTWFDHYVHG